MRLLGIYLLGVLLAGVLHLAWHAALPADHAWSLDWSFYWLLPATGFGLAGVLIARLWPERALNTAFWVAVLAVVLNQVAVPIVGMLISGQRFELPTNPVWWRSFAVSMAVGLPLLFGAAWLFRPPRATLGYAAPD